MRLARSNNISACSLFSNNPSMPLSDQGPHNLLDDNSLHSLKSWGKQYPSYIKWMNFCSVIVALHALSGLLLFGTIMFYTVPDLLHHIFHARHIRAEEYFTVVFILGSFLCCTVLLIGCWRAFQYHRALRSATFVDGTDAERWVHASVQGHQFWKTCAGATLILFLAWAPLLMYTGYNEIDYYLSKEKPTMRLPENVDEEPQRVINEEPKDPNPSKAPRN